MRERRHFRTDWCYHLISRIAHRAFFLTEDERTRFVDLLWRAAAFSGVEVLAYCFMTNHFHSLVYVPPPRELSDGPRKEAGEWTTPPLTTPPTVSDPVPL